MWKTVAVMNANSPVAKSKPEKCLTGTYGIRTHEVCDTGIVLNQ